MKRFAELFTALDQTTKINAKVAALADYFTQAPEQDRLWTIALLSGRRPRRAITTTLLREWAADTAGIPLWLFEECYPIVGDLAETISLILPPPTAQSDHSLSYWIDHIASLKPLEDDARKSAIQTVWDQLDPVERFLFNKLITGGFRVGVSQRLMTRALAKATGVEEATLAHRLMGDWTPSTTSFTELVLTEDPTADLSKPYPFYLAYALDGAPEDLGHLADWVIEHKWDGIRGQLILRDGHHFTWSRGEELMTDRFPEFATLADFVPPGTVLDGEILAWSQEAPLSFAQLQKRVGRKSIPKKLLTEAPVILKAYDLLEWNGADMRDRPLAQRRAKLEALCINLPDTTPIRLSPALTLSTWEDVARARIQARDIGAEGLMIKRADSAYRVGRKRGDWWKWKVDPLSIDAVMIYAQAGHGRRATLFTDFTFAVWNGNDLVPFTKAYSGLTDKEFREITTWVKKNTQERFGPVRRVTPQHVFEIHFEGIQESSRHKSGVALRFPRMSRWRKDKPLNEANTLDDLKEILAHYG